MQLAFSCPRCQQTARREVSGADRPLECEHCGWSHALRSDEVRDGKPANCLVCGCRDLWRQKDFPPQIGLTLVGLGALLSTIAWFYYWPVAAIGILMGFALADLLLYTLMSDVLVCYRCGGRHSGADPGDEHPRFDLEVAERYRQESRRRRDAAPQH